MFRKDRRAHFAETGHSLLFTAPQNNKKKMTSFKPRVEAKEFTPLRASANAFVPASSAPASAGITTAQAAADSFAPADGAGYPAAAAAAAAAATGSATDDAEVVNAMTDGGAYVIGEDGGYFWLDVDTARQYGIEDLDQYVAQQEAALEAQWAQQQAMYLESTDDGGATASGTDGGRAAEEGEDAGLTDEQRQQRQSAAWEQHWAQVQWQQEQQMMAEYHTLQQQQREAQFSKLSDKTKRLMAMRQERWQRKMQSIRDRREQARLRLQAEREAHYSARMERKERAYAEIGSAVDPAAPLPTIKIGWDAHRVAMEKNLKEHIVKRRAERRAAAATTAAVTGAADAPTQQVAATALPAAAAVAVAVDAAKPAGKKKAAKSAPGAGSQEAQLEEAPAPTNPAGKKTYASIASGGVYAPEPVAAKTAVTKEAPSAPSQPQPQMQQQHQQAPSRSEAKPAAVLGSSSTAGKGNVANSSSDERATGVILHKKPSKKRRDAERAMAEHCISLLQPLATELLSLSTMPLMAALRRETKSALLSLRVEHPMSSSSSSHCASSLIVAATSLEIDVSSMMGPATTATTSSKPQQQQHAASSSLSHGSVRSDPLVELLRYRPQHLHHLPPSAVVDFFHELGLVVERVTAQPIKSCRSSSNSSSPCAHSACWSISIPIGDRMKMAAAPFVLLTHADTCSNNLIQQIVLRLTAEDSEEAHYSKPLFVSGNNCSSTTQQQQQQLQKASVDLIRKDVTQLVLAAVDPSSPLRSASFLDICHTRSVDFGVVLAFVHDVFSPLRNYTLLIENIAAGCTTPCRFVLQTTKQDLRWAMPASGKEKSVVVLGAGERELWGMLPDAIEAPLAAAATALHDASSNKEKPNAFSQRAVADITSRADEPSCCLAAMPADDFSAGVQPTPPTESRVRPDVARAVAASSVSPAIGTSGSHEKTAAELPLPPSPPAQLAPAPPQPLKSVSSPDSNISNNKTIVIAGVALLAAAIGTFAWKKLTSSKNSQHQ